MSDLAIRAEGLSKRYRIGDHRRRRTLRDAIVGTTSDQLRRLIRTVRGSETRSSNGHGHIWALKDVSFEVRNGETVGVIGRNGAGKSTLLKILSRITDPTDGHAEIRGRVGSLLEVGTGFHVELTGRENIFLNGAILGMGRAEIEAKFDEIVEFAEVSRFIDTPVKHYSSGMYMRLAFAVAAHLEPEILLVDEVLAVGDMAFQRKCLGKMEDVAAQGRTVLFVSHNLAAVRELCRTAIVLKDGRVEFVGPVVDGLSRYSQSLVEEADGPSERGNIWRGLTISAQSKGFAAELTPDQPFSAEADLDLRDEFSSGRLFCVITNSVGETVVHQRVNCEGSWSRALTASRHHVRVEFPALWLAPGVYTVHFKFLGHKSSGVQERLHSERAILDVCGTIEGIGRAYLAPSARWRLVRERKAEARRV
jgi:lipopolysaccharide transport system ATP-binding protein